MCGILFARLKKNTNANFLDIFKDALNLMSYRGKDDIGIYQHANNYFGHARLSILDLSSRSNQPVIKKNTITLFKGEIYNFKQLVPDALSDTLALSDLIENGVDVTDKLCGMYAIIAYNKHSDTIKILRDFYGEKPVYYYSDENIFIASSTIKSITHILDHVFSLKLKIKHLSLYEYFLCGYVREPKTIYENIHMLSSGHVLNLSSKNEIIIDNVFSQIITATKLNTHEHARNCLESTDVQPGLLLSSGIDSTYILSLLNYSQSPFSILTYKASNPILDESKRALINIDKICKEKEITINVIENHQNIIELWNEYPAILEQPSSDGMNLFNILTVARANDNNLKLILLGTGGDELFGGYPSFKNWNKIKILRKLSFFKKFFPSIYRRFFAIPLDQLTAHESYYFLYRMNHHFLNLISPTILDQLFTDFVIEMKKYELSEINNLYHKIKQFESFDYMRNQLLRDADNISLFRGYEARNPLLAISSYVPKPDNKKHMQQLLKTNFKIAFTKKKGFTFCESETSISDFLCQKIIDYNNHYHVISESVMLNLIINCTNFNIKKKVYTLLRWLNANQISLEQLSGFSI